MAEPPLELRANRMDLIARWADDLAHEIKNPFHAMVINLELVKRRAASREPEPLVERAEIVEGEIQRVHALIDSLLKLLRPWTDPAPADVDQVFGTMGPVVSARARVRQIELEHHSGGAPVPMAPGSLALVLLNLLDNAMEATSPGGRVVTACALEGDSVRISILDTGAGLPDTPSPRLLEAGVSYRPNHAGLGLAITAGLVQEAGGTVTLQPGPGGAGAVVNLVLPRARSA